MKMFAVIFFVLFCVEAEAADKEHTFKADVDAVWNACLKVANSEFTLQASDKENHLFSFRSGVSLTSWGFTIGGTVKPGSDNSTTVVLHPQKAGQQVFAWGAGGRIADKFFKAVETELKKTPLNPHPRSVSLSELFGIFFAYGQVGGFRRRSGTRQNYHWQHYLA
jgi:hypothetical protein